LKIKALFHLVTGTVYTSVMDESAQGRREIFPRSFDRILAV
jgi:hypothetical protein